MVAPHADVGDCLWNKLSWLIHSAEERKDDIKRFQPGCKQVLALLRTAGDAANVHGFGHLGDPVRQVGSELSGSALYRAIMDLVHSPDSATDLPCKWSSAMVWNLCGFRFGGAPDLGKRSACADQARRSLKPLRLLKKFACKSEQNAQMLL